MPPAVQDGIPAIHPMKALQLASQPGPSEVFAPAAPPTAPPALELQFQGAINGPDGFDPFLAPDPQLFDPIEGPGLVDGGVYEPPTKKPEWQPPPPEWTAPTPPPSYVDYPIKGEPEPLTVDAVAAAAALGQPLPVRAPTVVWAPPGIELEPAPPALLTPPLAEPMLVEPPAEEPDIEKPSVEHRRAAAWLVLLPLTAAGAAAGVTASLTTKPVYIGGAAAVAGLSAALAGYFIQE